MTCFSFRPTPSRPIARLSTCMRFFCCFFFQAEDGIRDGTVTGVQTCALPICPRHPCKCQTVRRRARKPAIWCDCSRPPHKHLERSPRCCPVQSLSHCPSQSLRDRKSTRLNSSHSSISYAVFCLKKKKCKTRIT